MKKLLILDLAVLLALFFAGSALAVPRLQTYIVNSRYEYNYNYLDSRSWIANQRNFDLKVVGYWGSTQAATGGGSVNFLTGTSAPSYDYMDCYVAISVPLRQSGTVWINGVQINSFTNFFDARPEGTNPSWLIPLTRPSIFGKYNFQDIGRIDNSQQNAWHYDHGQITEPGWGDEILLDVVVSGFDWAHFDAIGVDRNGRTYSSTYDHDSSYFATPEPGTLSLLGLGLLGIAPLLRRKK
ncbi:MAG: choice-of-anchor N protein [Candidatus Krumholzibacteriota bacterium]|nr:choice-of-anchor N protein [Candidatus Krumholzibacteriota bacterium]